ncbi:tumor necrosis factor ligand superfamily member 10-like [Python bivittatus]|uniref:Tumor necrosis factor ligand superfamily member 10 n=1 Tax=Python bivittatus TaxID=176946 RepID=A0A9F2RBE2_PYTBI|nr:tumor necrosis factor ligand superfamily member 10-like [Python bivittatus]
MARGRRLEAPQASSSPWGNGRGSSCCFQDHNSIPAPLSNGLCHKHQSLLSEGRLTPRLASLRSERGIWSCSPRLAVATASGPSPDPPPPPPLQLKAQAQGHSEELRCLRLLNSLQELSELEDLMSSQPCFKLALSLKDYVATVTENVIRRGTATARASEKQRNPSRQLGGRQPGSRPLAHLTLRRPGPSQPGGLGPAFWDLQQSCQHPIAHWATGTLHTHLQNLTYQDGQLQVSQAGKYYVYTQIYFRYPAEHASARSLSHQLVQCINLQRTYGQTILLLKGVGTKCWTQDAAYGLHALYQGGLFDLKAGDRLFVSVSSLDVNYDDEAGSYFGAFRLDV